MSKEKIDRKTPRRVRQTARLARRLMPSDGDLDVWLQNLGEHRKRPIRLIIQPLGAGTGLSGMCVVRDDADYIVLDAAGSPSRRALVLAHEVAHLLLEHDGKAATSQVVAQVAPDLSPGLISRVLTRDGYDSFEEQDAEELATLLAVEHARRQRAHELKSNSVSARLR